MNKIIEKTHGSINLIGEYTEYSFGWVLQALIPLFTEVTIKIRNDDIMKIQSSSDRYFEYKLGSESKQNNWADYIQGVTQALREQSHKIQGADIYIYSTIPEGAGLSSSAALLIALIKCFRKSFSLSIRDKEILLLALKIENEFVGAKVGIIGQMTAMFGAQRKALYLDTKSLTYELIDLPDEMEIKIIHSGIAHNLSAKDGYNQRRHECEEINKKLNIESLREIRIEELKNIHLNETLRKRTKHIVTENERVHLFVQALKEKNFEVMGKLFKESHLSMRNDFEASTKEIDILTTISNSKPEVYGSKLTGDGFGGAVIILTKKGHQKDLVDNILKEYQHLTHRAGYLIN